MIFILYTCGKYKLAGGHLYKVLTTAGKSSYLFIKLRASLCKILISSFAHKMDFAHNFSVDFF